jgi:hypothetical protein
LKKIYIQLLSPLWLTTLISAMLIVLLNIHTQDGSPLLYQGFLLQKYIYGDFAFFESTFKLATTYTSWGGVVVSSILYKLAGIEQAERLMQLLHLLLFTKAVNNWSAYLKITNKLQWFWWLSMLLLFWSLTFTKGFYNYIYALDLVLLVLPNLLEIDPLNKKKLICISVMLFLSFVFHPLPFMFTLLVLLLNYNKKNSNNNYLYLLPSMLLLICHFMHIHSATNYIGYSIVSRIGDLVKGVFLASYLRSEFVFSGVLVCINLSVLVVVFFKSKNKYNIYIKILFAVLVLYLFSPQETSGGGLIGIRLAWLMLFFSLVYIVQNISLYKKHLIYVYINCSITLCFILYKALIVFEYNNSYVYACFENIEGKVYRLYNNTNIMQKNGWLFPVYPYQFQKKYINNNLVNFQNHFANSDYYPFTYKNSCFIEEKWSEENKNKVIKDGCDYLVTDSIIADTNFEFYCSQNRSNNEFQYYIYKLKHANR